MSRYARDPISGSMLPIAGGGGSSGHTIVNEAGTTYPARSKLKFNGAIVSDDETNNATVVETVNPVDYEEDIYGVNLIPYPYAYDSQTIDGVTWIVNADGSVKANGTNTGTGNSYFRLSNIGDVTLKAGVSYILSLPEASEYINLRVYNDTEGWSYLVNMSNKELLIIPTADITGKIALRANKGATISNVTCHPMLRKATIKDDTYRPFNEQSIQNQITDQTNVLGAKNLIPYPYNHGDTKTKNGVTFSCDTNGIITANGTASALADYALTNNATAATMVQLQNGCSYTLSGCPVGGGFDTYKNRIKVYQDDISTTYITKDDFGDGVTFSIPNDNNKYYGHCYIHILGGQTVNNLTFKPMLRLASDPDNTYVPYAMTNRELTEKITLIRDLVYPVGSIYMSANSTSPATLFGGTWEQLKDRFLLGAGDTYANGATGGEATHTLTADEMPSHTHTVSVLQSGGTAGSYAGSQYTFYPVDRNYSRSTLTSSSVGGDQNHNNMPPYLVVYMWKRTA